MADRVVLTLLVAVLIAAVLLAMRRAWQARALGQGDVQDLAPVPRLPEPDHETLVFREPVRYLGANRAGDWQARVVVHSLGTISAAEVTVTTQGMWLCRAGAPDVFLPAAQIVDVRLTHAVSGRVYERGGALAVTWNHSGVLLEVGMRVASPERAQVLHRALQQVALIPNGGETGHRG